jgi:hypothetical protein
MRRTLACLVTCAVLSTATVALADDPPKIDIAAIEAPEEDVGAATAPLEKGDEAPFTGVLLSPKAAATIVAERNAFDERIKIEVQRARAECQAKCDYSLKKAKISCDADRKTMQASLDERKKRIDVLQKTIADEEKKSKPNVWLWAGGGALTGALGTVGVFLLFIL